MAAGGAAAYLKKRKLLDVEMERKRELDIKEMCQALKEMDSELQNLKNENDRLRAKLINSEQKLAETRKHLVDREQQFAETRTLLVDREEQLAETRALLVDREEQLAETRELLVDREEQRAEAQTQIQTLLVEETCKANELQRLLPEKNAHETISEVVIHTQTPISPAKMTAISNRANQVQPSANATVHGSSFQDEATELDCCRRHMRISGNGTDESSSACVYHMLTESLVGMKVSLKNEMEGFSLSVYHEASGYSFTLTWLEQPDGGEWSYKYSSLGTLERIATKWMKLPEMRFSMTMCPVFFQQISRVVTRG